jgi:D-3-phosphoglycerate dehydrogenase
MASASTSSMSKRDRTRHPGHQCAGLLHRGGGRPRDLAVADAWRASSPDYDRATHAGVWRWQSGQPVYRLRGRTMGVVSLGQDRPGHRARARPSASKVIAYDPVPAGRRCGGAAGSSWSHKNDASGAFELHPDAGTDDAGNPAFPVGCRIRRDEGGRDPGQHRPRPDGGQQGALPGADRGHAGRCRVRRPGRGARQARQLVARQTTRSSRCPTCMVTPHVAYYSEESIQQARVTAATQVAKVLTGQEPSTRQCRGIGLIHAPQGDDHAQGLQ